MSNTGLYESDSEPEGSRYPDSDEESLVDVDSPSDGYFERREHPQTPFVQNPATQERSEEDKAREAAAERANQQQAQRVGVMTNSETRAGRGGSPAHHSQPRSPVWQPDEATPLLDAGPAGPPPDYAAATADRREGSYGSLSESAFSSDHPLVRNGLMNEQGVFGQRSQPQSMRDSMTSSRGGLRGGGGAEEEASNDQNEVDEERGLLRRQRKRDSNGKRRWVRHFRRKRLYTWVFVIATLLLILFFSGVFEDARDNGGYPSGGDGRNKPEDKPSQPDRGSGEHTSPKDPSRDSPLPPHRSTSECHYTKFSKVDRVAFASPANFSFLEFIENPVERGFFNDRITGTVQIVAAAPEQRDPIAVWISVALAGTIEFERLRMVSDDSGMEILFPDVSGTVRPGGKSGKQRWSGDDQNCLDFSIAITVRKGVELNALELVTANFDVDVAHGVFDEAEEQSAAIDSEGDVSIQQQIPAFANIDATTLTAVRGHIHAAYLSSRNTFIETTSASISGAYALRDILSVKSASGSISISVDPKPASADEPDHPAAFRASSNSGSVDVAYLVDKTQAGIPQRDYVTRVETHSSSIKGTYVFGSAARFDSNSGALDLSVLPYDADVAGALRTSSGSAHTRLEVLSPYTASSSATEHSPPYDPHKEKTLGLLHSTHKSVSGALDLRYPAEWEGVVEGTSVSGHIEVGGEGVELLGRHGVGRVFKHVVARKGKGDSRLEFETTSGGVDVLVG